MTTLLHTTTENERRVAVESSVQAQLQACTLHSNHSLDGNRTCDP